MIHFSVSFDEDGETRELRLEGTSTVVGWIEQGRRFIGSYGRRFSEWRFTPNDAEHEPYEVHTSIDLAYADARQFAATLGVSADAAAAS
jgi:hypothetical protein